MSKHNETVITQITEISKHKQLPIHEAVALYCEEHDIEPDELVKEFDDEFIQKLRLSAVEKNVRLSRRVNIKKHKNLW